jgi:hypothetical protein
MEEKGAPGGHALQHLVEEWEGFRSAPGQCIRRVQDGGSQGSPHRDVGGLVEHHVPFKPGDRCVEGRRPEQGIAAPLPVPEPGWCNSATTRSGVPVHSSTWPTTSVDARHNLLYNASPSDLALDIVALVRPAAMSMHGWRSARVERPDSSCQRRRS